MVVELNLALLDKDAQVLAQIPAVRLVATVGLVDHENLDTIENVG